MQANCGGILRGIGLHAFGAIFNFIGYYVITLPISIPLMLSTHLGVSGKIMHNKETLTLFFFFAADSWHHFRKFLRNTLWLQCIYINICIILISFDFISISVWFVYHLTNHFKIIIVYNINISFCRQNSFIFQRIEI